MIALFPIGNVSKCINADTDVFYQPRKFVNQRGASLWMHSRVKVECLGGCPDTLMRTDHFIHHVSQVPQKVQVLSKLVELNGSSNPLRRNTLSLLVVRVDEAEQLRNGRLILCERRINGCGNDSPSDSLLYSLILQDIRPLSPRDVNGDTDGCDAAHCLHPCRPVDIARRLGGARVLRENCPSYYRARAKGHYCNHCPVSVCPSLFHEFPLSLDWILPLGVTA